MSVFPNPVDSWSWPVRGAVIAAAIEAAMFANAMMAPAAKVMRTRGGVGIVGFELIGSWTRAEPLLDRWGAEGRAAARTTLWWDTALFIPAYTVLLGTLAGCVASHAADRGWTGWADVAVVCLYAMGAVALCDYVENAGLFRVLARDHNLNYPRIVTTASTIKWWLVAAVVVTIATVALLFVAAVPSSTQTLRTLTGEAHPTVQVHS